MVQLCGPVAAHLNDYRYTLPAIFRAPPEECKSSACYVPFVSPITADLISQYTIPVIRRTLEEMLAVGACLSIYSALPLADTRFYQDGRLAIVIHLMTYPLP